jgi:hypothetical protein
MDHFQTAAETAVPVEHRITVDLERQIKEWREAALKKLPRQVRTLAAIVRRAVNPPNIWKLERWCRKRGITIERHMLPLFRDFLITQLLELKDLEPAARARLRQHWLAQQDTSQATDDYLAGARAGEELHCRDCLWFVRAPRDNNINDPSPDKSCVDLGTKGADLACCGFMRGTHLGLAELLE